MAKSSSRKQSSTKRSVAKRRPRRRRPSTRRLDVTRQEYDHLVAMLERRSDLIDSLKRELDTQLTRIAQIQSQIDDLRRAALKPRN
jgi:hypothetical protein